MSNIIPANLKIPAHLANRIGKRSALSVALSGGLGGSGGPSFPRISIKGSRFRIVEDGTETVVDSTSLSVIIVGANPRKSKVWYAKAWDGNAEPSAPDCYSLDGISPHPDSTTPQNDMCAVCPYNAWGSKTSPTGTPIKACSDRKRLAVVAADDPSGPVYLLEVTPTAMKNLNAYDKELAHRAIDPEIVITKLSFDTDASFPKIKFSFGGFIDDDTLEATAGLYDSETINEIIGVSQPKLVALPAPTPRPSPVKQVVEPEPEEEPAPVVEEKPAPKRGFGAAKPAAPAPVKEKPAAKAAPVVADGGLSDEIMGLLSEVEADDA